jgi:hypothetical protein
MVVYHLIAFKTQSSFIAIKSQLRASSNISPVVAPSLIKFLNFSLNDIISYIQILHKYPVFQHLSHHSP